MKHNVIAILMWVVAIALSVLAYPLLPEQLPIHWGPSGEVDGYSSKALGAMFLPGMMVLVFFLTRVVPKFDSKKKNYPRLLGSLNVIMLATLALLLVVHVVVIGTGLGYDISMPVVMTVTLGALYVVMGNVMPRFKHNYSMGIRTPWTLASEPVWAKSHAVGGKVFFFGGFLLMACALLPGSFMMPVTIVVLLGIPLSTVIISYYYYKHP